MKEEIIQNINQGLEAAYINGTLASNLEYKPSFISNSPEEGKKVISSIEGMMIVNMLSLQRRKILIDFEIRKEPSDDRRLFHLLSRDKNMVCYDKS